MTGQTIGPTHHCPTCGAAVDPLQAGDPDGGCRTLSCRVRAREQFEGERIERFERRTTAARRALGSRGLDPDAEGWAIVPRNDACEVPLDAGIAADFRQHLTRVLDEAGPGGAPPHSPAAIGPSRSATLDPDPPNPGLPDAEREALARACASCRGWCCRRGGAHAFLDAASIARVRRRHPAWTDDEVAAAYLDRIGATHLEGGCLFQGPAGCRLPQTLRSETCNTWWCPDLEQLRSRWTQGASSPETTTFIAVATDPARIDD